MSQLNKFIVDRCRELRQRQTPEEKVLWSFLRGRKLKGFKFLRQHPFIYDSDRTGPSFFIADFYCAEKNLIVELDGPIHKLQKDYDENRDQILKELGLQVLRLKNHELTNLTLALNKIKQYLTTPTPSLRSREGAGGEYGIIILAAGASTRMGQSKQLLAVKGEPLLLRSINAAIHAGSQKIIVVLGANEKAHRDLIGDLNVEIVFNKRWEAGMGSSIKAGLRVLSELNPSLEGIVVLVCDQPLLTSDHIRQLISKHTETSKPIVASGYAATSGVPVFFHKVYFGQLMGLKDEQGAKKVIQENPGDVALQPFPQGEIDLDTPEDYERFKRSTWS